MSSSEPLAIAKEYRRLADEARAMAEHLTTFSHIDPTRVEAQCRDFKLKADLLDAKADAIEAHMAEVALGRADPHKAPVEFSIGERWALDDGPYGDKDG